MSSDAHQNLFPWIINLELTNYCNIKCIFCDHPDFVENGEMALSTMETPVLRKIMEDLKGHKIYELGMVGLGEPTINKNLPEHLEVISEYAEDYERIALNSNLVALNEKRAKMLLESCINCYTFSVNASNKEAYEKMMRVDRFDKVIQNLKTFLQLYKESNRKLSIAIQVFDSNQNDEMELRKLVPEAEETGAHIFVRKVYTKPAVIQNNTDMLNVGDTGPHIYPCWDIYTRVYFDVVGNYYPCTMGNDSFRENSDLNVGNVMDQSVLDIFHGETLKKARERSEKGELAFPECKECNVWSLTPNNFDWDQENKKWSPKEKAIRAYGLKGAKD